MKAMLEKPNDPVKKLMVESGYSPVTAENPQVVLQRPSFIAILDEIGITDNRLAKLADEALGANRPVVVDKQLIDYPDWSARHRYWQDILKVKKHLTSDTNIAIQANDYKVIIEDWQANLDGV